MLAQGSPLSVAVKLTAVQEDESVDSEIVCLSLHTQVSFIAFLLVALKHKMCPESH